MSITLPMKDAGYQSTMMKKIGITLLLLSSLFSVFAWGAAPPVSAPVTVTYSPAGQIIKMAIGLVIVLVMIFLLAWLARNYMGFNPSSNTSLKPLAGVLVGQKERVVLMQVGERQILIGVAPGQINLLHVIEKGDEVTVAVENSLSPFAEKLKRSLGRFEKS